MMADWKQIAKTLTDMHNSGQEGAVLIGAPKTVGEFRNLTTDERLGEIDGDQVTAKEVRRFLWDHRDETDGQGRFVWSKYDQDRGRTVLGIGVIE
jgi:hypothetical protein